MNLLGPRLLLGIGLAGLVLMMLAWNAAAADRTPSGRVSVAQLLEAVEASGRDAAARELLVAYLSGVAETAAALNRAAETRLGGRLFCGAAGSMDAGRLAAALKAATPDPASRSSVEAAPLLVADMLDRYGCPR